MALTMKEKYAKLDLSKLPNDFKSEFSEIKTDTENFDPELVPIFQENFDLLYSAVEKKHPDAIKKGGKLVKTKPATKKKPVAKSKAGVKKNNKIWLLAGSGYTVYIPTLKETKDFERDVKLVSDKMDKDKFPNEQARIAAASITLAKRYGYKLDIRNKEEPKPFTPKSRSMAKKTKTDHVEECRKVITEAGYTIKKKPSKSGKKVMKVKVQRQERSIIKDKVEDTFKTIAKDISGSEEKDKKYKEMQKSISQLQDLMTKFFNRLNNLAEDNSTEKIEKIIRLIKEVVKD